MNEIRNEKCFAEKDGECTVLIETKCENCPFYKPASTVNLKQIEKDIRNYSASHLEK